MSNITLLDTGVVGGLLSNNSQKQKVWNQFVTEMIQKISNCRFVIPTPVWLEIAQWNTSWYRKVLQEISSKGVSVQNPLFESAGKYIANPIIMDTALYLCMTREKQHKEDCDGIHKTKNKISFIDAIIASYCLKFGHFIITLNQQDFPDKFFEIVDMKSCPRSNGLTREFAWLLKPRVSEWILEKSRN